MRIFLIAGKAGSGKSEVAKFIKEFYIYKREETVITNFSKYIKNFAMEISDWDGQDTTKPRALMQKIGDQVRNADPDFLVDNMIKDMSFYNQVVQNVVVSDVRMPNEIDKIRDDFDEVYTFYIINQFGTSKLSIEEQAHVTETALENYTDFDYTIINDDLKSVKEKVFKILEEIK